MEAESAEERSEQAPAPVALQCVLFGALFCCHSIHSEFYSVSTSHYNLIHQNIKEMRNIENKVLKPKEQHFFYIFTDNNNKSIQNSFLNK